MTSSYDFLEELEEIDKMSLNADPRVSGELSTSMLETSLLDESMEVVNVGTKQFPMRKLLKIDPN